MKAPMRIRALIILAGSGLAVSRAQLAGAQPRPRATVIAEGRIVVITGAEARRLDEDVLISEALPIDVEGLKRSTAWAAHNPAQMMLPLFMGVDSAPVWFYDGSRGLISVHDAKEGPRRGCLGPDGFSAGEQAPANQFVGDLRGDLTRVRGGLLVSAARCTGSMKRTDRSSCSRRR